MQYRLSKEPRSQVLRIFEFRSHDQFDIVRPSHVKIYVLPEGFDPPLIIPHKRPDARLGSTQRCEGWIVGTMDNSAQYTRRDEG